MCVEVMMSQSFAQLPPVLTMILCLEPKCTDLATDYELADQFSREDHY